MEDSNMTTPRTMTLLDVVEVVSEYTTSEEEVVATVAYLINSGRVLLCGTFAGHRSTCPFRLALFLNSHPTAPQTRSRQLLFGHSNDLCFERRET
jgi:hypothetical protein